MKRMALVLLVGACSTVDGNERGGVMSYSGLVPQPEAQQAKIDAHCARYGKVARVIERETLMRASWVFVCEAPQ